MGKDLKGTKQRRTYGLHLQVNHRQGTNIPTMQVRLKKTAMSK